jgi:3-oxoacyl-[acyl-carrier protein] reductase
MELDMIAADRSLDGQGAVVTGGASGIGLEVCRMLGSRGVRIVVVDWDAEAGAQAVEELTSAGVTAHAVGGDLTVESEVVEAMARALGLLGHVGILVNNAGLTYPAAPLWETPTETWELMWRIHCLATYLTCRELVPQMIERGYGRIVNVASVAGKEGNSGSSAYSSAKAGVIGLTKSLGKDLATTGILVNVVTPGVIETPLMAKATPEHIARLTAKIPMGRPGRAEEVAELIAWLSSPACSFSTAAVFDASGGRTTY